MFHFRKSASAQRGGAKAVGRSASKGSDQGFTTKSNSFGSVPTGMPGMGQSTQQTPLDLSPLLSGFLYGKEDRSLIDTYKDIYFTDSVSGTAVDFMSTLPFSEFSLSGFKDNKQKDPFMESLDRLNLRTLLPEISVDYLVTGNFVGSLIFDDNKKIFVDIIPQDFKNLEIQTLPFYGFDPIISVTYPKEIIDLFNSKHPRIKSVLETYGNKVVSKIKSGSMELDPVSTIYLARRTMTSTEGISFYRRVLPIYFLEKNMFRGTLMESIKRQRAILHVTLGDQDWEPVEEDLEYVTNLFTQADSDPLGAVIATRNGVQTQEVRCLGGNTLINTEDGPVCIKDMVEHDPETCAPGTKFELKIDVQDHQANYAPVKYWWYQGKKPVFDMHLEDGSTVRCTENHRWLTVDLTCGVRLFSTSEILGKFVVKGVNCKKVGGPAQRLVTDHEKIESFTLKNGYHLLKVISVEPAGTEHVYDLTMGDGVKPLFLANNIVSRNSGGPDWSISDIWGDTVPVKLRALGISEAFLSGESNFNVVDAAISTFMENLQDYRDKFTRKLFSQKVFPLISLVNEFYADDEGKARIEEISKTVYDQNISSLMYQIQDTSSLMIPKVEWEKNLKPTGDEALLSQLETLRGMGVPIPLRVMAAAGGFNLDSLLASRGDDVLAQKETLAWKKEIEALGGGESEESMYASGKKPADWENRFQSLLTAYKDFPEDVQKKILGGNPHSSSLLNSQGKVLLKDRDFGEDSEVYTTDANGKRHYIIGQKNAQTQVDNKIIKSLRERLSS